MQDTTKSEYNNYNGKLPINDSWKIPKSKLRTPTATLRNSPPTEPGIEENHSSFTLNTSKNLHRRSCINKVCHKDGRHKGEVQGKGWENSTQVENDGQIAVPWSFRSIILIVQLQYQIIIILEAITSW